MLDIQTDADSRLGAKFAWPSRLIGMGLGDRLPLAWRTRRCCPVGPARGCNRVSGLGRLAIRAKRGRSRFCRLGRQSAGRSGSEADSARLRSGFRYIGALRFGIDGIGDQGRAADAVALVAREPGLGA